MRLTDQQKTSIIENFKKNFAGVPAQLWLFGSRVNNANKGGDIDLLIRCYDLNLANLRELLSKYDAILQREIGPRKIDIVLDYNNESSNKPIVINAKKEGIILAVTPILEGEGMSLEQELLYQRLKSYIEVVNYNYKVLSENEQSIRQMALYPLTDTLLVSLDLAKRNSIDALIYRFLVIQDHIGNKLFPLIAKIITPAATQLSWFDTLATMEKYNIITSELDWNKIRKIRNLFAHEYDEEPEMRAQDINELANTIPLLAKQIKLINAYAKQLKIL